MPEKLEKELKSEAKKKGLKGDRADAYVYGTLRKTGWKPEREKNMDHGKATRVTSAIKSHEQKIKTKKALEKAKAMVKKWDEIKEKYPKKKKKEPKKSTDKAPGTVRDVLKGKGELPPEVENPYKKKKKNKVTQPGGWYNKP